MSLKISVKIRSLIPILPGFGKLYFSYLLPSHFLVQTIDNCFDFWTLWHLFLFLIFQTFYFIRNFVQ